MKDADGRTPLHWAVFDGHVAAVRALVELRADFNVKNAEGLPRGRCPSRRRASSGAQALFRGTLAHETCVIACRLARLSAVFFLGLGGTRAARGVRENWREN
eukprot:1195667-Prorocentrum_minimum.AAC.4